jgi:hypothetical protein
MPKDISITRGLFGKRERAAKKACVALERPSLNLYDLWY